MQLSMVLEPYALLRKVWYIAIVNMYKKSCSVNVNGTTTQSRTGYSYNPIVVLLYRSAFRQLSTKDQNDIDIYNYRSPSTMSKAYTA